MRSVAQRLCDASRRNAARRGIPFTLAWQDLVPALVDGRCALTNLEFRYETFFKTNPYAPSIDRIESSLGYSSGNIRLVLWAINCARGPWNDEVLHEVCRAYLEHSHK